MVKTEQSFDEIERLPRGLFLFAILSAIGVALVVGQSRFVGRDEGYYLYAARLILEGQLPYRDFFFPQLPLTPFLYAGWFAVFGKGWIAARGLSSLATILAGFFLFQIAKTRYGHYVATLSLIVYSSTAAAQLWLSTAQANTFAITLLLAALYIFERFRNPLWTGFAFSLALVTRLTFAPIGAVFILLFLLSKRAGSFRSTIQCLLGMILPLLLVATLIAVDSDNFYQHNFIYHLQRTSMNQAQVLEKLSVVLKVLLGFHLGVGLGEWQFSLLLYSASIAAVVQWRTEKRLDPLLIVAALLFFIHLTPAPTYTQYFSIVALPLIPASVNLWIMALGRVFHTQTLLPFKSIASVLMGVVYLSLGASDFYRFTISGDRVIGVGARNHDSCRLSSISKVSKTIDTISSGSDFILSSWPGYLIETEARALPGTENHFGLQWVKKAALSPQRQRRLKIRGWDSSIEAFASGEARLAALYLGEGRTNKIERKIVARGGKLKRDIFGVRIYGHLQ